MGAGRPGGGAVSDDGSRGERQARQQHGQAATHMPHARRAVWGWRESAVWVMEEQFLAWVEAVASVCVG